MRFTILAKELLDGLKAINTKEVFKDAEILDCVKITLEKDEIILYRNVLNAEYQIKMQNNDIADLGTCLVNQKKFMEVLKNFGNQFIEIYEENSILTIKSKTIIIQLKTFDVADYPKNTDENFEKDCITLSQKDFKKAIKQIEFATSTDECRLALTGICFNCQNKNLELVAIDGFRLALKRIENKDSANIKMIVPKTIVMGIISLFDSVGGIIKIEKNNKTVSNSKKEIAKFTFAKKNIEITITARLIDAAYMDYNKVIDVDAKTRIEINSKDLKEAFQSVYQKVAKGETNIFTITAKENKLTLKTRTTNGTADIDMDVEIKGEGIDSDFNPKYFAEMCNALDDENLIIRNGGGYQATVIKNEEDTTLYLILPLRR